MTSQRSWEPVRLTAGSAAPVGAFSPAAKFEGLVFTSGQVPQNPQTGEMESHLSFADQTRLTFRNLERVLEAAGASLANVVSVTVYLADMADWPELNQIYGTIFEPPFPARAVVGADLLGFRVEASAIAVAGGNGR